MLRNGVLQRVFMLHHLPLYLHRPSQPPGKKNHEKANLQLGMCCYLYA